MKIAIITGASSGMGRRMAIELNDTIPNIEAFWLFGRRNERLEALEKQLTKPCRFFTDDLQTSAAQDTLQRALAAETPENRLPRERRGLRPDRHHPGIKP